MRQYVAFAKWITWLIVGAQIEERWPTISDILKIYLDFTHLQKVVYRWDNSVINVFAVSLKKFFWPYDAASLLGKSGFNKTQSLKIKINSSLRLQWLAVVLVIGQETCRIIIPNF